VILFNHSDEDFVVSPGDRIAQLVLEVIQTPAVVQVESLEDTARGEGGFGSTGVATGGAAGGGGNGGDKKQRTGE
jgi:dUTP pyrophosphatase